MTAVSEGTATSFTPLEFKLLKLLSLNPNTVLTRQYLLYSLWDRNGNYVEETSLNSMICRIRHRIDTENHHYIKTIYGIVHLKINWGCEKTRLSFFASLFLLLLCINC